MRIAIVGTGISGLVCAHLLHRRHDLSVFEADGRVGGHTHTVAVELDDGVHHVDTGFIVYNERNYPNFTRLLRELDVPTRPSDMSFAVSDERNGLEYRATSPRTLFARRSNLFRPSFHRLLADVVRFHRNARRLLADPDPALTLDEFLERGRYSKGFIEDFIVPLGSAVWSADPTTYAQFPMASLARFLDNHGLLSLRDQPQWRTVVGGSSRYTDALIRPFSDRIRLNSPVDKIVRRGSATEVSSFNDGAETFDRVILACHSDQALELLSDPSDQERAILGAIPYRRNVVTLHTDGRFLPRHRRARASWNYHVLADAAERRDPTVTYWMNNLQGIGSRHPLLVTLNRHDDIEPSAVLGRFEYDHPVFDRGAMAAQQRRHEIQGARLTYFAGAYWGYGFHEDGVRSALDVCAEFGTSW